MVQGRGKDDALRNDKTMNLFYQPNYGDNFLQRWFWRFAYALWTRLMNRFGQQSLKAAGFVFESIAAAELRIEDEKRILSTLLFLTEVAQESDEVRIADRAVRYAAGIAAARQHRCGMDWIRELPDKATRAMDSKSNAAQICAAVEAQIRMGHSLAGEIRRTT